MAEPGISDMAVSEGFFREVTFKQETAECKSPKVEVCFSFCEQQEKHSTKWENHTNGAWRGGCRPGHVRLVEYFGFCSICHRKSLESFEQGSKRVEGLVKGSLTAGQRMAAAKSISQDPAVKREPTPVTTGGGDLKSKRGQRDAWSDTTDEKLLKIPLAGRNPGELHQHRCHLEMLSLSSCIS